MQRVLRGRIAKLRSTFGLIVVLVAVVTVGLPTSTSATQSSSGVAAHRGTAPGRWPNRIRAASLGWRILG